MADSKRILHELRNELKKAEIPKQVFILTATQMQVWIDFAIQYYGERLQHDGLSECKDRIEDAVMDMQQANTDMQFNDAKSRIIEQADTIERLMTPY